MTENMIENAIGENRLQGRLEVICGSMFSGKTEELIRRLKRARIAKQRVMIFKPKVDTDILKSMSLATTTILSHRNR